MSLSIAYLVNQYPSVSHTFIRREIHALERHGHVVHRIALRGWSSLLVDKVDLEEQKRTRYVLQEGILGLARAVVGVAFSAPVRLASAARLAARMSRGSDRPIVVHLGYLAEACVIRRWLKTIGATHLHAHFATNPAEIAMLVNALGGPPYSFTAHGSDIMDRPAQMALAQKVDHARFVAAVCSFGRNQLFRWIPYSLWSKVSIVRCGLQRGYGAGSIAPGAQHRRLVCIGRLSKEKGQSLLIEAIAKLRAEGTAVDVTLIGDGPMRSEIEQLIMRQGLDSQVRMTGWLDATAIEDELRQARALVVPSLSEGLPVVIMEAMASRRPVIAPFLAGIPELVIQGETGWLYPASDVAALQRAIKSCLQAPPDVVAAMGDRACQVVWTAHDADLEAGRLLALMSLPVAASEAS